MALKGNLNETEESLSVARDKLQKVKPHCALPTTHTEALGQQWASETTTGPHDCMAPLSTDRATLDKLLNLSGPQFPLIQKQSHIS